jgi:hypothetical protein
MPCVQSALQTLFQKELYRGLKKLSYLSVSICLHVYLSVCMSICIFLSLSVCMSICLSPCLSVSMSICLHVYLYVCMSLCLHVNLSAFLSVCLHVYLSVCMSLCLHVNLSACLSICLFPFNANTRPRPRCFLFFSLIPISLDSLIVYFLFRFCWFSYLIKMF